MNFREEFFCLMEESGCTSSESTKEETENKADTKEETAEGMQFPIQILQRRNRKHWKQD